MLSCQSGHRNKTFSVQHIPNYSNKNDKSDKILAHPNLKLFITHGGFVSSVETAYHGVPILAIPIFGDQKVNANFAKANGFGRFITYKEISEESLLENINEMLNNPK
jgi:UDP:flavonoid glycosyltransferase YjiC (YdhE family)